jgi:hypothetical protein
MNVAPTSGLASCHFRDLAEGLQQQMFFLGQDVIHPEGTNLSKIISSDFPQKA